jgi:hypothetical protein
MVASNRPSFDSVMVIWQVAPEWERLTAHIEADPVSKEKLGWVREMYAFSTAVALKKIKLDIVACPECPLISQVSLQIQFWRLNSIRVTSISWSWSFALMLLARS